jgi:hypothetical protein
MDGEIEWRDEEFISQEPSSSIHNLTELKWNSFGEVEEEESYE